MKEAIDKFVVGSWTISLESGTVSNENGDEICLEPRLAKLFYYLSKNSSEMVSRKQLIDQIWHDTIVNEESLTRAISDLRKVLNKHFDNPPQIETIPTRGYKMILCMPLVKRPIWKMALKYFVLVLLSAVLFALVIRGLNY